MIKATVKRVVDGDTLEVSVDTLRLRMDFIDTPETRGPEREDGLVSKEYLKKRLAPGAEVDLDIKKFDMYDRALTVIYLDGDNINGELLEKGLAEVYSPANHNNNKKD